MLTTQQVENNLFAPVNSAQAGEDAGDEETVRLNTNSSSLDLMSNMTGAAPTTSEQELREGGQTVSEAQRNVVQANVERAAMERFQRVFGVIFLCCLCCLVVPLVLGIAMTTIWASFALNQDQDQPCDTPIRVYLYSFIFVLFWNTW